MTIVVIADGVVAVEHSLNATSAEELYDNHKFERDLAEDSIVEEACRIREATGGSTLTLVSAAPEKFEKDMRSYIAAGCQNAIRIDVGHDVLLDPRLRAAAISACLKSIGDWRLVIMLDRSAGGAGGVVPHYVSELLDVPSIASVTGASIEGDGVEIRTRSDGIIRTYRSTGPIIAAMSSRVALRYLGFKQVFDAKKAMIESFDPRPAMSDLMSMGKECLTPIGRIRTPRDDGGTAQVETLPTDETVNRIFDVCRPYLKA